MLRNKFIKNLYQITSFALTELILIIPAIVIYILTLLNENYKNSVWILLIVIYLIILYFLIGFYWIFQTILIDEKGIQIKLFKKTLRRIDWNDIEDIAYGGVMRNPAYIIKVKSSKDLNIDSRKKIKKSLLFYGDERIKHMIEKLKK